MTTRGFTNVLISKSQGGHMHGDYGWGMGFGFGWIFMIVFWALVIVGIVYFVKTISGSAKKEDHGETALDILKKRYAKGEISREEFEKIRDDLIKG
jgi:putative membrane protein